MLSDFSLEEAQKAVKGIAIPAQPKLLTEINDELQKRSPDVNRVAERIAKDVGLSAAVLKVINSPFFGLRSKVSSIPNAVHLLGMNNVKCIITGMMLKTVMGGEAMMLERFWDSSEKIAKISTYLASILPKVPRDETYTFGLFRECGIPLLMQRFPDYRETLKIAGGQSLPLPVIEDQRHGTNHAVVGYMVAKTWGLADMMSGAILRHHDYDMFSDADDSAPMVRTLVSINYLAEYLNDEILRMRDNLAWRVVGGAVLENLGIGAGEFSELRDDIGAVINQ
jgi:HD-like signal output (HDOD) protein